MKIRHLHGKKAFSLIELLVVVAIISLLTGLLTPGISALNRAAKKLKQKSVFHGYETGLELFHSDFDDYPDSHVLPTNGTNNLVCGAQHLADPRASGMPPPMEPMSMQAPPGARRRPR